jgi:hypothetical protein
MSLTALANLLLLLVTLGYVALCAVSPFGRCRSCDGLGFHLTHTRRGRPRRGRHCYRCDGHGIRIRFGRYLWNRWSRIHRDGTR